MSIKEKYQQMYDTMVIKDSWKSPIYRTARKIVANRDKYEEVSKAAGGQIPWQFIGLLHNRESGCDFSKHLHEGSPLTGRTRLVPRGRPKTGNPPFTFTYSAVDALTMPGKAFHKITDWSYGNIADFGEKYNGLGYRNKGIPSPYLWSGSQHYVRGKYIRDHVFSRTAVDQQMGIMPLLKAIDDVANVNRNVKTAEKESRRMKFTKRVDNFLQYVGLSTAAIVSFFQEARNFVTDNAGIILLVLGVIVFFVVKYIRYTGQREVIEGRFTPSKAKHK